jgi:hypothetical protein
MKLKQNKQGVFFGVHWANISLERKISFSNQYLDPLSRRAVKLSNILEFFHPFSQCEVFLLAAKCGFLTEVE